jgi:hypothetical protein
MIMRSIRRIEIEKRSLQHVTGYAWHLGFFVVLLLFGPPAFFEQFSGSAGRTCGASR